MANSRAPTPSLDHLVTNSRLLSSARGSLRPEASANPGAALLGVEPLGQLPERRDGELGDEASFSAGLRHAAARRLPNASVSMEYEMAIPLGLQELIGFLRTGVEATNQFNSSSAAARTLPLLANIADWVVVTDAIRARMAGLEQAIRELAAGASVEEARQKALDAIDDLIAALDGAQQSDKAGLLNIPW